MSQLTEDILPIHPFLAEKFRLVEGIEDWEAGFADPGSAAHGPRDNAEANGVDPARITVGGASAGGNLAAGATLRLRDDDSCLPATLVLA